MTRTRNHSQLDLDNVTGNNWPPRLVTERSEHVESWNVQPVTNQMQVGDVDIPRQLIEEQRIQMEPYLATIATMRRIIEEQHNNLANLVTKCMADMVTPLMVNTIHDIANKQGASSSSTQS